MTANVNSALRSGITIDELVKQFDELSRRVRVLEGRAGIAARADQARLTAVETALTTQVAAGAGIALGGAAPVTQTLVLYDVGVGAGLYSVTTDLVSGNWTTPRAGGTYVIEGQLNGRAEAWDNFVAPPRREANTSSTPGSSATQGFPSPASGWGAGDTVTLTFRDSFSVGLGTFNAKYHLTLAGSNQIRINSGWLRVTWTG